MLPASRLLRVASTITQTLVYPCNNPIITLSKEDSRGSSSNTIASFALTLIHLPTLLKQTLSHSDAQTLSHSANQILSHSDNQPLRYSATQPLNQPDTQSLSLSETRTFSQYLPPATSRKLPCRRPTCARQSSTDVLQRAKLQASDKRSRESYCTNCRNHSIDIP